MQISEHSSTGITHTVMNGQFSWSEWFSEWWGSERANEVDFTRSQLSLEDGWGIIESDSDKVFAEETKTAAQFRRQEVEKLSEMARTNYSNISKIPSFCVLKVQIGNRSLAT